MKKQVFLFICAVLLGGSVVWVFTRKEPPANPLNSAPGLTAKKSASHANPTNTSPGPSLHRTQTGDPAAKNGEQQKLMETLRDNIVIDLGKVEDIGHQVASMMTSRKELEALRGTPAATRTPEQNARLLELERQSAAALGMLTETASFQNNPDEYARFFGSMLQQAASLDANQTSTVSSYMRDRAQAMIAAGFNAANEPTDPGQADDWEVKRDAFNKDTANGVAKLLPPGMAESVGFTPGFLELMEQDFQKDSP